LANRLRSLAGYQAMARCLGVPFSLCWIPSYDCNAAFTELFDTPGFGLVTTRERDAWSGEDALVCDSSLAFRQMWEKHLTNTIGWTDFMPLALDCLRELRPLARIRAQVDSFTRASDLASMPGVHIRWTDNRGLYGYWSKHHLDFEPAHISQLAGFASFIKDYLATNPTSGIFLGTDNQAVEGQMVRAFGERVRVYPKQYRRRLKLAWLRSPRLPVIVMERTSSIEEALVEMLLLARCRLIVGTYYSSFSEIAALWGNRPHLHVRGRVAVDSGLWTFMANSAQAVTDH
jgi:hypothetical protein